MLALELFLCRFVSTLVEGNPSRGAENKTNADADATLKYSSFIQGGFSGTEVVFGEGCVVDIRYYEWRRGGIGGLVTRLG